MGIWGNFTVVNAASTTSGTTKWARSTESAPNDSPFSSVSTDTLGNVYAAGYINGNSEYNFGNDVKVTGGGTSYNAVIVKYDSSGVAQWAKSAEVSSIYSEFKGVSTDTSGNVYAVGLLGEGEEVDFGNEVTLTGAFAGGANAFIVKYDSDGVTQWAKTTEVASSGSDFLSVSADTSGNVYAVGHIKDNSEFDFGDGVTVTGVYDGDAPNPFIIKYNSDGVAQWAKTNEGAPDLSEFFSVSADASGNVYVVGYIYSDSEYDFGNGVTVAGTFSDSGNIVIVKYNSSGVAQWAKSTEVAPSASQFYGVSTDTLGNVYAVGYINGNIEFGFGNDVTVTGAYGDDDLNAFIVKYDSSGVAQWAKSAEVAPIDSQFYGVSTDTSGNAYAAGYIDGNSEYDFGNDVTVTGGYGDDFNAFIIKYDSSGVAQWAKSAEVAPTDSQFYGVSADTSGNAYVVGYIYSDSEYDFGNGVTVTGGGEFASNSLIVKYEDTVISTVSTPAPSSNSSTLSSAPSCNDTKPSNAPDLFQIDVNATQAKLFYAPVNGSNSSYYITYSETPNTFQYGTQTHQGVSTGVLSYTINLLKPNTTYYFRIRGQNGCMPGDWSNEMKIKTRSKGLITKVSYYKNWPTFITATVNNTLKSLVKGIQTTTETVSTPTPTPFTQTSKPVEPEKKCFLWWCW